jgi:hypothetical protein
MSIPGRKGVSAYGIKYAEENKWKNGKREKGHNRYCAGRDVFFWVKRVAFKLVIFGVLGCQQRVH